MGSNPTEPVSLQEEKNLGTRTRWGRAHARQPCEERDAQREDFCMKMEAKTGVMLHKLRNMCGYQSYMCGYQSWER